MSIEAIARIKLQNLQSRVDSILGSDTTPFESVPDVLGILSASIEVLQSQLDKAVRLHDRSAIESVAENVNIKTLQYLPIIGMVLRSTNVRNAFELLDPLQRISAAVLGKSSRLILSSEWDYIPFAYPQSLPDFPAYTFIGLPASETANLLVLPLAGHELGHSTWKAKDIDGALYNTLEYHIADKFTANMTTFEKLAPEYDPNDIIKKFILDDTRDRALEYAVKHSEEIFCDLFGLGLFGESYLKAFSYILSPSLGTARSSDYPSHSFRASALVKFANSKLHLGLDPSIVALFKQQNPSWMPLHGFIIEMAEKAVAAVLEGIWGQVDSILQNAKIERPISSRSEKILVRFRKGLPSSDVHCVADVINAIWRRFDEVTKEEPSLSDLRSEIDLLNEMGLKTIEAFEYNQRIAEA